MLTCVAAERKYSEQKKRLLAVCFICSLQLQWRAHGTAKVVEGGAAASATRNFNQYAVICI
jgi:hypothetical protein